MAAVDQYQPVVQPARPVPSAQSPVFAFIPAIVLSTDKLFLSVSATLKKIRQGQTESIFQ
jgi:hypothetical protein